MRAGEVCARGRRADGGGGARGGGGYWPPLLTAKFSGCQTLPPELLLFTVTLALPAVISLRVPRKTAPGQVRSALACI